MTGTAGDTTGKAAAAIIVTHGVPIVVAAASEVSASPTGYCPASRPGKCSSPCSAAKMAWVMSLIKIADMNTVPIV